MAQVYAPPTPSTSTAPNGMYKPLKQHTSTTSPALSTASLYSQGTRAFLSRDFLKAATCLDLARPETQHAPDDWFRAVQSAEPDEVQLAALELERRVAVLEVTLLATAHSTEEAATLPWSEHFARLFSFAPKPLLETLWANLTGDTTSRPPEILASPSAGFVHPSLASTLVLAALKLDQPHSARAMSEAWFGSVAAEVDDFIADVAARIDINAEFPVAGQGSIGSSQVLQEPGAKSDHAKQLVGAWIKLHDSMCLHVLPRLGEWEAAADAVRAQAEENGGWVPQERVEAALRYLEHSQQELARAEAERLQREHDQDLAKAAAAAAAAAASARSSSKRRDKEKGKHKANGINGHADGATSSATSSFSTKPNGHRPSSTRASSVASSRATPRSPTDSPPQSHHPSHRSASAATAAAPAAETSFSGMRSSLSRYLASGAQDTTAVTSAPRGVWAQMAAKLQELYAGDPVRLLGFVCAAVAVVGWVKRVAAARRARGESGFGLGLGVGEGLGVGVAGLVRGVGAKVLETVRMGTKVTTL